MINSVEHKKASGHYFAIYFACYFSPQRVILFQSNVMVETCFETVPFGTLFFVFQAKHTVDHGHKISTFQHGLAFILPRYTRVVGISSSRDKTYT